MVTSPDKAPSAEAGRAAGQLPMVAGRPRIFDASEGTKLDPLLNKTYDLSYTKVVLRPRQ